MRPRRLDASHLKRGILVMTALAHAALGACDAGPATEVASAHFALSGDAAFFRLRIFKSAPADLNARAVFDTGCLQQQSRTYELSNIPVGTGYVVVYEGFPELGCDPASALALGYRGGVTIRADGELPYYHVPVYPRGAVATLPEEINLSASVATAIDFCDDDGDCGDGEVCYDEAKPAYWCVPSCQADVDCRDIHVRASCDTAAGWCTLKSPFPLNLSEPRTFGAAATLSDGDVLFVGGMRQDGVGSLLPTMHPLERFDSQSGLFAAAVVGGNPPPLGGDFGFAELAPDRLVTVGGFLRAKLSFGATGLELSTTSADVSADLVVWDLAAGTAASVALPRAVARPAVVRMAADRFFVAGGLVVSGPGLETTRGTTLCTLSDGAPVCETGPMLEHPRQGAAAACLDEGCERILIVGGNPAGRIAEVVDLSAQTATALETVGFGDKLFHPVLCGLDLVAGSTELSRAVPFSPVTLAVEDGKLVTTPIAGAPPSAYLPAVSGLDPSASARPGCWLGGGLEGEVTAQVASVRITRARDGVVEVLEPVLGRARFGGMAAEIGGGLLAGKVIFAGGVTLDGSGPVRVVRGAEVLSP